MRRMFILMGLTGGCFSWALAPKLFTASSGPQQVHLIELYTSQNCPLCGQDETFLASLVANRFLWKHFVPIQFYVSLEGDTPQFSLSQAEFTARRQDYGTEWGRQPKEPPLLILDGKEWTMASSLKEQREQLDKLGAQVGVLSIKQNGDWSFGVRFRPISRQPEWFAYGALLGNGIEEPGEPSQAAPHDFVALSLMQTKLEKRNDAFQGNLQFSLPAIRPKGGLSAVFWVSQVHELKPEQAAGGNIILTPTTTKKKRSHR